MRRTFGGRTAPATASAGCRVRQIGVEGVLADICAVRPAGGDQVVAAYDVSGCGHQPAQQLELRQRQRLTGIAPTDLVARGVELR